MTVLKLTTAMTIALATLGSIHAQEGKELAELAFESIDTAGRDFIDMGEFATFGSSVFAGMDYDDNGKLTLKEFLNWDFGMQPVAQEAGRAEAYDTALRVVFAFWDRNGDNEISKTEHRQSLNTDFQRADTNNDATLTKAEFLGGFSVMVAMRAAINPIPVE